VSRLQRIRHRDFPQWAARRAIRAGILVPGTFAISYLLLDNPTAALFSAFGSVTMLLYVDFGGPIRPRVQSQAVLIASTLVLLCVGTVAAQNIWVGTAATLVVTFVILFSGIISSVLASAQTSLLISFLLPLTLPGSLDVLPDRLLGWLIAAAGSLIAITLIWRGPTNDPLRIAAIRSVVALGKRVEELAISADERSSGGGADMAAILPEVATLKRSFLGAPYRPAGLGAAARELAKIIQQQLQLDQVLREIAVERPLLTAAESAVLVAGAGVLAECGGVLAASRPDTSALVTQRQKLAGFRRAMEDGAIRSATDLPRERKAAMRRASLATVIRPSFDGQEVAVIVDAIAEHTILSSTARNRSWIGHLVGLRSQIVAPTISSARDRLSAHLDWGSVWLHNALRGSVGFTLTVFLANAIGVQHAFWVAFGTLAVLRSNASSTGQTAVKAILGTVVGIIIGGVLLVVIGPNTIVCWVLLPVAVAFTGLAPAFSFIAGQAGFSVVLILLFDLMSPIGWTIGVVRIEDVALGCAVSVVVSLLLWPRGAGSSFSVALAAAFTASARYLAASIDYALKRCSESLDASRAMADDERLEATDAARRLDDSFRQLLAERGSKLVSFDEVACLVNAVAVVRGTADQIRALWQQAGDPDAVSAEARLQLLRTGSLVVDRYEQIAAALLGRAHVPQATSDSERSADSAVDAIWSQASISGDVGLAGTVRLVWTLDYIQALFDLDQTVLPAATQAARASSSRAAWLIGIRRVRASLVPELAVVSR
jgi:Fusaric acid resistance protein-like